MQRRLTLLRHAKSSWSHAQLDDFDRPLNKRGQKVAPAMGKLLRERGFVPQTIFSSTALRAKTTAQLVASEIGYDRASIHYSEHLYHASVNTLLSELDRHTGVKENVMLVGHNPGLTQLVNLASDASLDNLPTCGIVSITAERNTWSHFADHPGKLDFILLPRVDLA